MRLRILFVDYGEPADMPNAEAVTDEYMEDAWNGYLPEFYAIAVADAKAKAGDEAQFVEAFVTIPDDAVRALFATPVLKGVVKPVTP